MSDGSGVEREPARLALGLALSALAGFVDAVGVLTFGGLFVAFMSGNTTRLGIDAMASDLAAVAAGALVIGAFVVGALAGTLLRAASGPRLGLPVLLAAEAGLLGLATAIHAEAPDRWAALPLALAMGLQNLARQGVAGAQTGATFVTGTLVGLGQSLAEALLGRPGSAAAIHAAAWAALLAGTAAGAVAVTRLGPGAALGAPTAALLVLAGLAATLGDQRSSTGPASIGMRKSE